MGVACRPRPSGLVVAALVTACLLDGRLVAPQSAEARQVDAYRFFGAGFDQAIQWMRPRLAADEPAARVIDAEGRDVSVVAAIPTSIEGSRLLAWARAVDQLQVGPYVKKVRRFSNPPVLSDVADLVLDNRDLEDLRRCRIRHCGLKLSDREITDVQHAAARAGDAWRPALIDAFKRIVTARAAGYSERGFGAETYHDKKIPVALEVTRRELAASFAFLDQYPTSTRESFLYWSIETLGGRPIVGITESTILSSTDPQVPEALLVSRRVFANHYFEGTVAVTAVLRTGQVRHLVYINRSRVDLIDGPWGGLIRRVIERRVREEAPSVLGSLKRKLESGAPRLP